MAAYPSDPRNRARNRTGAPRLITRATTFFILLVAGLAVVPALASALPTQDACTKTALLLTVEPPTVQLGAPVTVTLSATPGTCTTGFSEPVWTALSDTPFDDLVLTAAPGGGATAHSFTMTPVMAGVAQLDGRVSFETQITDADGTATTTFVEAIAAPAQLEIVDPNAEPTATPTATATATATATPTPAPSTATPLPTVESTPTTEPTATEVPSPTAEASPTADVTEPTTGPDPSPTAATTPTPTTTPPTETPVPTVEPTATQPPTATPTAEATPTPTETPTGVPTGTPAPPTATATPEAPATSAPDAAPPKGDAEDEGATPLPLQPTLTPLEPTATPEPTATALPPLATIVPVATPGASDGSEDSVIADPPTDPPDFGEPVVLLGFTEEDTPTPQTGNESATDGALSTDLRAVREPDSNGMLYLGIAMLALAAMSGGVILFREWLQS